MLGVFEFAGGDDVGAEVGEPEVLGATEEEDGAVGFGQQKEEREEGQAGVHEADPEGPAPADGGGGVAGDDGGDERAEDCSL